MGGTYIQGAIFNPRTLISILNIFRGHCNFFEPRQYTCPHDETDDLIDPADLSTRGLRYPGTQEMIATEP